MSSHDQQQHGEGRITIVNSADCKIITIKSSNSVDDDGEAMDDEEVDESVDPLEILDAERVDDGLDGNDDEGISEDVELHLEQHVVTDGNGVS